MRRLTLCLLSLAVAACARERAERGSQPLASLLAGTWEGRTFVLATDSGVPWTNVLSVGADGALIGSLTYTGTNRPATAVRTADLTDSSVTWEIGPFYSPAVGAEVNSRASARYSGDSIWGTFEARPVAGGEPVRGTFRGKRTHGAM